MLRSSLPIGRFFGVDVRVHISFPLLLALAAGYAGVVTGNMMRGIGLWLALCFAVLVREVARALAAAYAGLDLRGLVLLPIGGVMALAPKQNTENMAPTAAETRLVTAAGPVANFLVGLILLGLCCGFVTGLHMFAQPWIDVTHVLRSFIWMQAVMAVVGLLPSVLPAQSKLAGVPSPEPDAAKSSRLASFNLGTVIAIAIVLAGMVMMNLWIVLLGAFMLLGSQLSASRQAMSAPGAESIQVRDVMLTEYTLLSTSDTLVGALQQATHSLQDVFPVVRGDLLVGSVARSTIVEKLQMQGDGYLQGVMTRGAETAAPDEMLLQALRRTSGRGTSEFIPVVEDGAMLGMLTPQSLSRAVQVVKTGRGSRMQG